MKVGVLGGGQLGRMLALAGYPLGMNFRFLDSSPEAPAEPLAEFIDGSFHDDEVLARFAGDLDVVTYEFENVPVTAARQLAQRAPVYPPPEALDVAQDRLSEKTLFRRLEIPTPRFAAIDSKEDLHAAVNDIGLPAVLKTRRLGYDGKGQRVLRSPADVDAAWTALSGAPLILEQFIAFDRELSVLAVRGRDGDVRFYPLSQNSHAGGILRVTLAPAPNVESALEQQADRHARAVLETLGYVGVLAIEFFEKDGVLLANEMAPRVHNSGHWTIEGAQTSQFENHLRAVCSLPLGDATALGRFAMFNIIGETPPIPAILKIRGVHLHLYGKQARAGRKLGHVNVRLEEGAASQEQLDAVGRLTGVMTTLA
jgi:5-(carboxyamino)imidazole ribonucleotide synthase